MNKDDLTELREIFRARMEQEDFCIGQEQVEKLFRELLGEPEPAYLPRHIGVISTEDFQKIISIELNRVGDKMKDLFESDSILYERLKK